MLPTLDELRDLLSNRPAIAFAVVFGSFSKGTAREDSDLDIAILPTGAYSSQDEGSLADDMSDLTQREVDLVRLDRTDDVILRREIARGTLLWERVPGAFARFRAEAMLEWLDMEPVYLDAQARFLRRLAEGVKPA